MKLYKILYFVGNHGVSVFPPEGEPLPPVPDIAGEPMLDIIKKVVIKGYTNQEAYWAVQAWAYHARYDLNQTAVGVRVFCEQCAAEIPVRFEGAPFWTWELVIVVAVAAAIFLGLYVWAVLGQEYNVRFGTHDWAYLMRYESRLWAAEILNVGRRQEGMYEESFSFGDVIARSTRDFQHVKGRDWIWLKPGSVVKEGRRVLFYHVYQVLGFYCYYCGLMNNVGNELYKLREGGSDPYKPVGIWSRPGGRWGQPDYAGCWGEWWWL